MRVEIHIINGTRIAELLSDVVLIHTAEDALDILGNLYYQDVATIIMQQKNITPEFFDLKNGRAGEILQKFSNYRVRLAIVGDFTSLSGKSIQDFIFESNKYKQINFLSSVTEALEVLSDK